MQEPIPLVSGVLAAERQLGPKPLWTPCFREDGASSCWAPHQSRRLRLTPRRLPPRAPRPGEDTAIELQDWVVCLRLCRAWQCGEGGGCPEGLPAASASVMSRAENIMVFSS